MSYTSPDELTSLVQIVAKARRIGIFTDYDGVWTPIVLRPEDAAPSSEVQALLSELAGLQGVTTVLVSGRKHEDLDAWFGDIAIDMSAEHGVLRKTQREGWARQAALPEAVRYSIIAAMERAVRDVPGSHIERKTVGAAWHYRVPSEQRPADADAIVQRAQQLHDELSQLEAVQVIPGHMVVDVQPSGISKGQSVAPWLIPGAFDVVIALGDDTTDESLLQAVLDYPARSYAIAVGNKIEGTIRLPDPAAVHAFFAQIIAQRTAQK